MPRREGTASRGRGRKKKSRSLARRLVDCNPFCPNISSVYRWMEGASFRRGSLCVVGLSSSLKAKQRFSLFRLLFSVGLQSPSTCFRACLSFISITVFTRSRISSIHTFDDYLFGAGASLSLFHLSAQSLSQSTSGWHSCC